MKVASAATLAILNNSQNVPVKRADCYTFTLKNGTVLRFTSADIALTIGGFTFGIGPVISRTLTRQSLDLNVDTIDIDIYTGGRAGDATQVNGKPMIQQFIAGLFDGATVTVQKAFLTSWTDTSPGLVNWFSGHISDIQCGLMSIKIKVSALTDALNQQMPNVVYQASCNNTFCDANCTLLAASFATAGQTASGTITQSSFGVTGTSRADGFYTLGKVKFTSGANSGISRSVKSYLSNVATVFKLFPYPIVAGDVFTISQGCDKQQATCTSYSNLINFRGYPYIPTPETAIAGGTSPGSVTAAGFSGGTVVGSSTTSNLGHGTYVP